MDRLHEVQPDEVAVLNRPDGRQSQPERQPRDAIDVLSRRHALLDQCDRFPPHRVLQPVADEAGHVLLDADGDLADRFEQPANRSNFSAGVSRAANHFDHRHQMRRVPEMGPDQQMGRPAAAAHLGDRQPAGRRNHHRAAFDRRSHAREQRGLLVQVLGDAIHHQVRPLVHPRPDRRFW